MNMDKIVEMTGEMLGNKYVVYPVAISFVAMILFLIFYVLYTMVQSYRHSKRAGKPTSWLLVLDDIRWSVYSWNDRDKEYVISLPRLIYAISAVLIIYVVIRDKSEMLVPLLGFNITAASSYLGKRYAESKAQADVNGEIEEAEGRAEHEREKAEEMRMRFNNIIEQIQQNGYIKCQGYEDSGDAEDSGSDSSENEDS